MEATETIENKGTLNINRNVEGENIAMRDFNQNIYHVETKPSFSLIEFENEETYPDPIFTDKVFNLITQKRILIIKGNSQFDSFGFGRKIAQRLQQNHRDHKTLELIQNEEDKPLNPDLRKQNDRTIILLNALHPRHIQYDFSNLINLCEDKQSFYIINTESSIETWSKAGRMIHDFWFEIPEQNLYRKDDLTHWFIQRTASLEISFLPDVSETNEKTLFSETKTLSDIVETINTPQKLIIFLSMCRNTSELFQDRKLDRIISNLNQSQEEIISKWFNNLNSDQKIIALTTALFNGLFCNQYFEMINKMISTSFWRQSSQTLEALDYCSLDFLQAFFRFETTDEGDLIVARNPTTRVNLLKTAITQYPRHIEKALLIFSEVMQHSYKRKDLNWDLHGTTQKRALLRQVFIEATRDIGVNTLSNIERIYLELAASNKRFIQGIAAKSLAQYRMFDQDDLLFDIVNKWLNDSSIEQRVNLFLEDKSGNDNTTISAIKTTTVRTLAYAADYDQPNQLNEKIINHLISFSKDADGAVQKSVSDVLPKFITHHAYQLRNEIFDDLIREEAYGNAISKGLTQAYQNYPLQLKEVIDHWLSICTKDHSKDNQRQKTTYRDNTLISILGTLSEIEVLEQGYSLDELYEIAVKLLESEKRKTVLYSVLSFIVGLQSQDYNLAFDKIPQTIKPLGRKGRKKMVRLWALRFMKERQILSGGEFRIIVHNTEYPAWSKMVKRPLTPLEEALFVWLNSNSKIAKRFATLTFLEIARLFEKDEYEQIKAYVQRQNELKARLQQERVKGQSTTPKLPPTQPEIGLDFWLRIKIFFYLLFEDKENKESLKDIIKLFLAEPYSKVDLRFVIYKWESRKKGNYTSKMAKWLNKFINSF